MNGLEQDVSGFGLAGPGSGLVVIEFDTWASVDHVLDTLVASTLGTGMELAGVVADDDLVHPTREVGPGRWAGRWEVVLAPRDGGLLRAAALEAFIDRARNHLPVLRGVGLTRREACETLVEERLHRYRARGRIDLGSRRLERRPTGVP